MPKQIEYQERKNVFGKMNMAEFSIDELKEAYSEVMATIISIKEDSAFVHARSSEIFFWNVIVSNIKKALHNKGFDIAILPDEEQIRQLLYETDPLFFDTVKNYNKKTEPSKSKVSEMSQQELAELLKRLLPDPSGNMSKISTVLRRMSLENLFIVRRELNKTEPNAQKYQEIIKNLDIIRKSKFNI